jgi:ribosomal protein L37AE/L43A
MERERLTVRRTATGYWVVQRGSVTLAGGVTQAAAEAELKLLERLSNRDRRRSGDFRTRAVRSRRR